MNLRFTKQDAIFKHRVMWCHIGHYLEKFADSKDTFMGGIVTAKADAFVTRFSKCIPPLLRGNCFLCHYAYEMTIADFGIDPLKIAPDVIIGMAPCELYCPLNDFANSDGKCLCGLYNKIKGSLNDGDLEEASKIAYEIAFLKEVIK
jgi:hypothetical protein